jgi:signal transduction histidine kinase
VASAELGHQKNEPATMVALKHHQERVDTFVSRSRNTIFYYQHTFLPVALTLFAAAILVGWAAIALVGRSLSRQLSAPLDELAEWTGRIRRRESLPAIANGKEREFVVLQQALREMQADLNQARDSEIEAERLRTFGEVARRVAHEMKNPLTPIRLAVAQMARTATPENREMLEVIATESARLEAMAREFAQLGRLPDGVAAPVDLRELLDELLRSTVPDGIAHELRLEGGAAVIEGYYDPLRRAFSNLLRNAVEACGAKGLIRVQLATQPGAIEVCIADNGPGIPEERREMIFLPYFTDKGDGTGLGLAIVRQTIEQHRGTITVSDTPGGGATFLIRFPI